jgi:hypothetical protein
MQLAIHRVNNYESLEAENAALVEALEAVIANVSCGRPWKEQAKAALEAAKGGE